MRSLLVCGLCGGSAAVVPIPAAGTTAAGVLVRSLLQRSLLAPTRVLLRSWLISLLSCWCVSVHLCRSNRGGSSAKRGMPQQASSKKRAKRGAGAAGAAGYAGYEPGWEYAVGMDGCDAGVLGYGAAPGGAAVGAFKVRAPAVHCASVLMPFFCVHTLCQHAAQGSTLDSAALSQCTAEAQI